MVDYNNKIEIKVRHHFDHKRGEFYYSMVDIIEKLEISKDSRNYWKVLKNRLNKRHNELVTGCNQLKILAKDGKYYQTDTLDANNVLKIIQLISPHKVKEFGQFFDSFEKNNKYNNQLTDCVNDDLSTDNQNENNIYIDMYLEKDYLIIKSFIPAVNPENIFLNINYDKLTIRGNQINKNEISENNYFIQELVWGKFSRTIPLPKEVDIDQAEASFDHGLLTVKLSILDKGRTKIIKVINKN